MTASTATTDTPLRHAWLQIARGRLGGLAPRGLNVLFQVRFSLSGLRAPVSLGVLSVSSRTLMNHAGSRFTTLSGLLLQILAEKPRDLCEPA